jgi:hypothetical protein
MQQLDNVLSDYAKALEKYLELNPNAPERERIEGMIQQLKNDS